MKKAIIILSGGLDSTVLTYYLKSRGYTLIALTFNYRQRHLKEIGCAMKTCKKLNILGRLFMITLPFKSALLGTSKIPKKKYSTEIQKQTVVPNRNMIMLSYAIGLAEDEGINKVFYAAHKNDEAIYPDCRRGFVQKLNRATMAGTYNKVRIIAPFINRTKADIVRIGQRLNVPFEDTTSCYVGKDKACGKCSTCRERIAAFKKNNFKDPIEYYEENN